MKSSNILRAVSPIIFSLAAFSRGQEAPAKPESASITGQLHLKIIDGKGKTVEIRLPKNQPMQIDLTPWGELIDKAGGLESLVDSAADSMNAWAADFARRIASQQAAKVAWLGVAAQALPDSLEAQMPALKGAGLLVRDVAPSSPAAAAGLKANDVLTRFNDQQLFAEDQLKKLIASQPSGAAVELTWMREGTEQKGSCTLGAQAPAGLAESLASAIMGRQFGKALGQNLGSDAERIISQILSNPKLLDEFPALKQVVGLGADGKLDVSGLAALAESAGVNPAELRLLAGEVIRTLQSEADINTVAEKLRAEFDAVSPELKQRAGLLMKILAERLSKSAEK